MSWDVVSEWVGPLAQGLLATVLLSLCAIVAATALGSVIGSLRAEKIKFVSPLLKLYVDLFRGIPLLVLLLFVYFGSAFLGMGGISSFGAAIIALTLYESAYVSEIFRGGLEAVATGQREAGFVMGLSRLQVWRKVSLPQTIPVLVPPLIGQWLALIKDTSLASIIGVSELMLEGQYIVGREGNPAPVYAVLACIYFMICYPISRFAVRRQRKTRWLSSD